MLPSCKQVAEQASENIDTPLTGMKWFKMKIHLLICAFCRRYNEQMILSSETVKSLGEKETSSNAIRQQVAECYHETHNKH